MNQRLKAILWGLLILLLLWSIFAKVG